MYGDFSRVHRADARRQKTYWRALLQQGRPLLDSDVNALVDTQDANLRRLSRDVACEAGSTDGGFFVTPGRLLARFDDLDHVTPSGAAFRAHRDYLRKLHDRLPSLFLGAVDGAGNVTVKLRHPTQPGSPLRLWLRGTRMPTVIANGVNHTPSGSLSETTFGPHEITVSSAVTELTISLPQATNAEAWIALIEQRQNAGTLPGFWTASGGFHLDGWRLSLEADGQFPNAFFPTGTVTPASLSNGALFVAFLEARERVVTRVEDAGIHEAALGGSTDTWTRTEILRQVKWGQVTGLSNPPSTPELKRLTQAFRKVSRGAGKLKAAPHVTVAVDDPCAIPVVGGYTGPENRLYRFEVHVPGARGTAQVKWSRNNAADLWRVNRLEANAAFLAPWAQVEEGDLLELVNDESELGDNARATATASTVTAPALRTGSLYYAGSVKRTALHVEVALLRTDKITPAGISPQTIALPSNRLRRWSGVFTTPAASPWTYDVEDGVQLTFADDDFRAGDFWQYEARKRANTDWPSPVTAHGPERAFAPLALLRYAGQNQPLEIVAWLDEHFRSLCELRADDIAYDGGGAGTGANTVQEALDELYARHGGGCCTAHLDPGKANDDDAVRLRKLIEDKAADGGTICLDAGRYLFKSPVILKKGDWVLRGCPDAFIEAQEGPAFVLSDGATLTIEDLVVVGNAGPELVHLLDRSRFFARDCALIHAGDETKGVVIRVGTEEVEEPPPLESVTAAGKSANEAALRGFGIRVGFTDCFVSGSGWCAAGEELLGVEVTRSILTGGPGCLASDLIMPLELHDAMLLGGKEPLSIEAVKAEGRRAIAEHVERLMAEDTSIGGTVVWAASLVDAEVNGATLVGSVGLRAARGERVQMEDCAIASLEVGVRFDAVNDLSVRGGTIISTTGIGVHVPGGALSTRLHEVVLDAPRALVFAGDFVPVPSEKQLTHQKPPSHRLVQRLVVSGCHLTSSHWCLQLGRLDGSVQNGMLFQVVVEGNTFLGRPGGVAICASAFRVGDLNLTDGVVITDNVISVDDRALELAGGGLLVSGNRIVTRGATGYSKTALAAILIEDAQGPVVRNNVIALAMLAPKGSIRSTGIRIGGGERAEVAGNTIEAPPDATALQLDRIAAPRVFGNHVQAGTVAIHHCDDLVVRENVFGGRVVIDRGQRGVVSDNRFGFRDEASLSLIGEGAWQVQNNRAPHGGLLLLPAQTPIFLWPMVNVIKWPLLAGIKLPSLAVELKLPISGTWAAARNESIPVRALTSALHSEAGVPVTALRGEQRTRTLRTEREVAMSGRATTSANMKTEVGAKAQFVAGPGAIAETPSARISEIAAQDSGEVFMLNRRESAVATQIEGIVGNLAQVFAHYGTVQLLTREVQWHAQVEGNWAAELRVGSSADGDANSSVQVVGNRVDGPLFVKAYAKRLVANNAVRSGIPVTAGPLVQSNLAL